MLILTRGLKQKIRIGDKIHVVILEVRRGQVTLGIEAPENISVHREEIYIRLKEEKQRASEVSTRAQKMFMDVLKPDRYGSD